MATLIPRRAVPAREVPTLDGPPWRLSDQRPPRFSMIVFYRGLHCPVCAPYVRDLDRRLGEFDKLGVQAIAVSCDPEERAREAKRRWHIEELPVGYDLDLGTARRWGLYISTGRGKTSSGVEEPAQFSEPGLFLVRPDGTLYASSVNTMPFARPHFDELLRALEFIIEKDYPARGEAT